MAPQFSSGTPLSAKLDWLLNNPNLTVDDSEQATRITQKLSNIQENLTSSPKVAIAPDSDPILDTNSSPDPLTLSPESSRILSTMPPSKSDDMSTSLSASVDSVSLSQFTLTQAIANPVNTPLKNVSNPSTSRTLSLPDLSGLYFDVVQQPLDAGDNFDIDFWINNSGVFSSGTYTVDFYLSTNDLITSIDYYLGSATVFSTSGSSVSILTDSLTLPSAGDAFWNGDGTYYVGMLIDSGNVVSESDETNNSNEGLSLDYDNVIINNTVSPADLTGGDFNVVQEPLDAGDSFTLDFEIDNLGGMASGTYDVEFYLSTNDFITTLDYSLGSTTVTNTNGLSTSALSTTLSLPDVDDAFWTGDGTYYIGMRIDPSDTVSESDEFNNSNEGWLLDYDDVVINNTVSPADLTGGNFNVMPEPLDAGDSFTVDFEIDNLGATASGTYDVEFYLSTNDSITTLDYSLGSTTVNNTNGLSTSALSTTLSLPDVDDAFWTGDGTYYIGMRIDPSDTVSESDEFNNSNEGWLLDYDDVAINNTISPADLTGGNFNVMPEPLDAGDSFTVDFEIDNLGGMASGTYDVEFYLSTNDFITTADYSLGTTTVTNTNGLATSVLTTTLSLPDVDDAFWTGDGTYYIGMRVDSSDTVSESDESNNSNEGWLLDYDDVFITVDDAYEQNDTLATAYDLSGDERSWLSSIAGDGIQADEDWYEIEVTAGYENLVVDLQFTHADGDIDLEVYDSAGTLVGLSDSVTDNEAIDMIVSAPGTYYLKVDGFLGDTFNTYDLRWDDLGYQLGTDDNDTLIGADGRDTIEALRGDDDLYGRRGNDRLYGDRGDDDLYGGLGNDDLDGGRGDDRLIGVAPAASSPGTGEIDVMTGGFGADEFVLGDSLTSYYNDGNSFTAGANDYALITDFEVGQDVILLHGTAAEYQISAITAPNLPSGLGIFQKESQDELIAIVQGANSLTLTDSYFDYVVG